MHSNNENTRLWDIMKTYVNNNNHNTKPWPKEIRHYCCVQSNVKLRYVKYRVQTPAVVILTNL